MLVRKNESLPIQNASTCTVHEYSNGRAGMSVATAWIHGRYPENHRVMNTACEQIYYVTNGSGTIHSDGGDFSVGVGDVYFFELNEAYWIDGRDLHIVIVNSPRWTPEQYASVDV